MAKEDQAQQIRAYTSEIGNRQVLDRLSELYEPQSLYTPEQKVQAAAIWLMTGLASEAGDAIGAPHATIRDWVTRKAWWPIALDLARKVLETKLDKTLDGLLRKSLANLEDRLTNGDDIVTKDGQVVKRKVGARDCAIISDILYNKRAALRGQPGNITERRDAASILDLIRKESGKHGQAKLVAIDRGSVVSGADAAVSDVHSSQESGAAGYGEGMASSSGSEPFGSAAEEEDLEPALAPSHINPERL